MGLADNDDNPGMSLVNSGRGLSFRLYRNFTTALVQVSSTVGGEAIVINSFKVDEGMSAEEFQTACAEWSNSVDDDDLRALRVKYGAYPLIRSEWDGNRCKVSVAVPAIGAAAGVVRVAEEAAARATMSPGMVEVDRTEGQRTGEGIVYGFVFEHFDQVNAAKGVRVEPVNPAEFRCGSYAHKDANVPATVRVTVPVPGRRELVSLTECASCWADAVVHGLNLRDYETDNN